MSGLLACHTSLDPFEVIQSLREFAKENPYQFRFAIRFTPLEYCVPTEIERLVETAKELLNRISEEESFRVTVRRRHSDLESMDVVKAVAAVIPRKVDLDHPDKTLWIEIVGEWTGLSILDEETDILSIMTMRDD
ncbi:MAG: THUMP domain-containing protein, partial [Candidatus Hodarchaeota archaeon]